jgi:hypothetical protein
MAVSRSEAPGPLVHPQDVEVGKEYFFRRGSPLSITKAKVTRVDVIPDPLDANGWRNRVIYEIHLEDKPVFVMFWNPEGDLTLETHFYKIYKIINPIFERRKHILSLRPNGVGGRRQRSTKRHRRSTKRRYKRHA